MTATLLALMQATALKLDDLGVYLVATSGSTFVTSVALVNATTGASTTQYDDAWVYASGQQHRVRPQGYDPTLGQLLVYPNWASNPAGGSSVYVTRLFPFNTGAGNPGEDTGYREIVQAALRRMVVGDRLTTAITTAESYSLSAWPWLDRQERLVRLLEPAPTGSRLVDAAWRGPRIVRDGNTFALEIDAPFLAASGSLTLEVLRPANTWVQTASVWTETSPSSGPTLDADQCVPNVEDVLPFALLEAYALLLNRAHEAPGVDWSGRYAEARAQAMASPYWDWTAAPRESPGREAA